MHMVNPSKRFTLVVGLIALAYILAVIEPTLETMALCHMSAGYNPHGTTDADMYPPDTWAGTCKSTKDAVLLVPRVLNAIFAPFIP